jgi:O-methyltransferase
MLSLLKRTVSKCLNAAGFAIIRYPNAALIAGSHCLTMRQIHSRDVEEIEELYRLFVFPNLPRRNGRAKLLNELMGTSIGEAIYIIHHLYEALRAPGDICEFGVAQGATSSLLAAEILPEAGRKVWLFDSFEGLPAPTRNDRLINDIFSLGSMHAYKGTMSVPETEVRSKLASINFPENRTKIKKGWVRDTIRDSDVPTEVSFAYVDLDFYDPIKDALEFLDCRMPVGGRIVVDDYGWFSEGAQIAVDEFMETSKRFKFETPVPCAGNFCILTKIIASGAMGP